MQEGGVMNYHFITDTWILARPKIAYYGAYPTGFLERARILLTGWHPEQPILHICAGRVAQYKGKIGGIKLQGYGPNDITLDLNKKLKPDIVYDARNLWDTRVKKNQFSLFIDGRRCWYPRPYAVLIDRPYTEQDADEYAKRYKGPGAQELPNLNRLIRDCLHIAQPGGIVAVLDYVFPNPGKNAKCVFKISVSCGFNNRERVFSGFRYI